MTKRRGGKIRYTMYYDKKIFSREFRKLFYSRERAGVGEIKKQAV